MGIARFIRPDGRAWLAALALLSGGIFARAFGQAAIPRSGPASAALNLLAGQAMITLEPPPAWDRNAPAAVSTIEDIKAEFAKVTDTPPPVNFVRTTFVRPDQAWLKDFKEWFRALEKPLRLRFEAQVFDCDNYANCFVAFADLLTLRAGESRGPVCVGWATVYYERPFAGVRGGAHAVVIAAARQGIFVIEPQTGEMVPLRQFPNRHTIEHVYF